MDANAVIAQIIAQFGSLSNWEAAFKADPKHRDAEYPNGYGPSEDPNLLNQGYTPEQALAEHLTAFGAVRSTTGGSPSQGDWNRQWQARQGQPRPQLSSFMPPEQVPQAAPVTSTPIQGAAVSPGYASMADQKSMAGFGPQSNGQAEFRSLEKSTGSDFIKALVNGDNLGQSGEKLAALAYQKFPLGARSFGDWLTTVKTLASQAGYFTPKGISLGNNNPQVYPQYSVRE